MALKAVYYLGRRYSTFGDTNKTYSLQQQRQCKLLSRLFVRSRFTWLRFTRTKGLGPGTVQCSLLLCTYVRGEEFFRQPPPPPPSSRMHSRVQERRRGKRLSPVRRIPRPHEQTKGVTTALSYGACKSTFPQCNSLDFVDDYMMEQFGGECLASVVR